VRKLLIIFAFLLFPVLALSAVDTHYVTQSGAGGQDGTSLANAWAVSDFNTAGNWDVDVADDNKIGPGDTVYFSGTITGVTTIQGSGLSGNVITIDGYEAGDCDPLNSECTSSALWDDDHANHDTVNPGRFRIIGKDYITVQDIRMKDVSYGIYVTADNTDHATYITIKRSHFEDSYASCIGFKSPAGIGAGSNNVTIGGALGDGNYIKNCGYNRTPWSSARHDPGGTSFFEVDDLIVSYNEWDFDGYSDDGNFYWASNLVEVGSSAQTDRAKNHLWEYNIFKGAGCEVGLDFKEHGVKDIIIRFNIMHTNLGFINWYEGQSSSGAGVAISGGGPNNEGQFDVYVYGNLIYNNNEGIRISKDSTNVHVWSNIIRDNYFAGIYIHNVTGDYTNRPQQIYVYNNTFDNNGLSRTLSNLPCSPTCDINDAGEDGTNIVYDIDDTSYKDHTAFVPLAYNAIDGVGYILKNNIFFNNRDAATNNYSIYMLQSRIDDGWFDIDENNWFNSGVTDHFYWGDSQLQTLAEMVANTTECDNGESADPGFTNAAGNDFTLDGTNINHGEDLSQCFNVTIQGTLYNICYDDALDPNFTDWTTTPPTVGTVKRDDHGWDRGAYVFFGSTMNGVSISMVNP
jgi:hypothetical protein